VSDEARGTFGLVVLPSIVSGIGVALVLLGIFLDSGILRDMFLAVGVLLLWLDFFITMAIFRRTVRDIDARLRRIDGRLPRG
jgi:hypothetical protein